MIIQFFFAPQSCTQKMKNRNRCCKPRRKMVGEKFCCRLSREMVFLQCGFADAVETLTWAVPGIALLLKSLLQATQENGWGEICCGLSREMVFLQCAFANEVKTLTGQCPGE